MLAGRRLLCWNRCGGRQVNDGDGLTSTIAKSEKFRAFELLGRIAPGLATVGLLAGAAWLLATAGERLFPITVFEPLVVALLLGMLVRLRWAPPAWALPGVNWSSKQLLEAAIVLLGASLNLRLIQSAGPRLLAAVVLSVTIGVAVGTILGRRAGLSPKLAILVAVGNAICGNSAIVALAPSIRARKHEIASAVALTAVLGVGLVLLLPLLMPVLSLTQAQYGMLAGLTVYAVPQVLAATFPVSAASGQIGTLVKLTRVLLLGPVVVVFAFLYRNETDNNAVAASPPKLSRFLPWFLVGFLGMALLRTGGLIPASVGADAQAISKVMTLVAMAGLGLSVDLATVRSGSGRVAAVVVTLLVLLVVMALVLIKLLAPAA